MASQRRNRGRGDLPSSEHISTEDQAKEYWGKHFGGKTLDLTVHSGKGADGNKRKIPVRVRFGVDNDHAYTDDAGGKQKTGVRVFDKDRAQAMQRILSVIEHPKRRLRNYYADLLLERQIGGKHYTVVLTWRDSVDLYEFHSAHFKSARDVELLQRHNERGKNKGLK
jgi:hypothetical protein